MTCRDYLTLTELKSLIGVGSTSDAALALMLMGASDWLDEQVFGHTFNRAIRLYYAGAGSAATVTVAATKLTISLTSGGVTTATDFLWTNYATVGALVDGLNGASLDIEAEVLHASWIASQPTSNLSLRGATSILGIANFTVLCLAQLSVTLSGEPKPYLWLPLQPAAVYDVTEDGVALTAGTDFYIKEEGYLIRTPGGTCGSNVQCGSTLVPFSRIGLSTPWAYPLAQDTCFVKGKWSCASPCNIAVDFKPLYWDPPRAKIGVALGEFLKGIMASSGFKSESIGRYSYTTGDLALLKFLLQPLQGIGLVIGELP